MTLYCGIDLHSNNSVVSVIDDEDKIVVEKRLPNQLMVILELLMPYVQDIYACVVESTYNSELVLAGGWTDGQGI